MKKIAAFVVLLLCAVAWAGDELPENHSYRLSPSTQPGSGFIYVIPDGYWTKFTKASTGVVFTFDPDDNKYHATPPSLDCYEFSGGGWTFSDYPEPPDIGPPVVGHGTVQEVE